MNILDILEFGGLRDAQLKAGLKGATNEVASVSVLEVAETRIKTWVLEKQLYITSFYAIMQNIEMQKDVIQALHEKGSAGLVICHIDLFIKEIHPDIIDLCNKLSFPLIVANSEMSYVEIVNPIVLRLSGDMGTEYNRVFEMQNKLIENIATKKDVSFIYKTMADEYIGRIFFLDINNKVLYPKSDKELNVVTSLINNNYNIIKDECKKVGYCIIDTQPTKMIILYIQTNGLDYGTIVAEYLEDDINKTLRILRSFASLCTLILTKSSRIAELEAIKKQEYISDLITWNFRSEDVAIKMGQEVGWNIMNKGIMIIINLNHIQESIDVTTQDFEKFINEVLYNKIKNIVKSDNDLNLIGVRSDIFIILLEQDCSNIYSRAKYLGKEILKCCNDNLTGSVSIGISENIDNYKNIPNAYLEATDAVKIGRTFFGANRVICISDLGFYAVFKEISNIERFKSIKNSKMFDKLKTNDEKQDLDLYLTLKSLIYNNMNTEQTAKELFLHKNTVNYRKKRIADILGYEPWNMPYLLNTLIYIVSEYFQ